MSILIENNEFIAWTDDCLKTGDNVEYAYDTTNNTEQQRECTLSNYRTATISNDTNKYENYLAKCDFAAQVNEKYNKSNDFCKEFLIHRCD